VLSSRTLLSCRPGRAGPEASSAGWIGRQARNASTASAWPRAQASSRGVGCKNPRHVRRKETAFLSGR
jgi:hypothetical protein